LASDSKVIADCPTTGSGCEAGCEFLDLLEGMSALDYEVHRLTQ